MGSEDDTDYDTAKTNKRMAKRIAPQDAAIKDYLPETQKQKLVDMQYADIGIAAQRELAEWINPNHLPNEKENAAQSKNR